MIDTAKPWARIKEPAPLPQPLTAATMRELAADDFEQVALSNLLPRDGVSRRDFDRFWWAIAHDDDLADQVEKFVEQWMERCDQAAVDAEPAAAKRIKALRHTCEDVLNRIDRMWSDDEPLAWAGAAGNFDPAVRKVIVILVSAMAKHRAAAEFSPDAPSPADEKLWQAPRRVGLDPRDFTG